MNIVAKRIIYLVVACLNGVCVVYGDPVLVLKAERQSVKSGEPIILRTEVQGMASPYKYSSYRFSLCGSPGYAIEQRTVGEDYKGEYGEHEYRASRPPCHVRDFRDEYAFSGYQKQANLKMERVDIIALTPGVYHLRESMKEGAWYDTDVPPSYVSNEITVEVRPGRVRMTDCRHTKGKGELMGTSTLLCFSSLSRNLRNRLHVRRHIWLPLVVLLMVGLAQAREYQATRRVGALHAEIRVDRNPPVVGDNRIEIELRDQDGKSVTDATVLVNYYMPPMPRMAPMNYITDAKLRGEKYRATMNFIMSGPWIIAVKTNHGGKMTTAKFNVDAQ